jgi:hypothetical protein
MANAEQIIKQAKQWIGKRESNGSHKEIIDIYNAHTPLARNYKVQYTDAWCATFVSAVAIVCKATDIIPTECSCAQQIELFKQLGCWVEDENRTPLPGDIIYYDWEDDGKGDNVGHPDHVGIVERVVGNTISVIEGNISNKVGRRLIFVNSKRIRGYAVPKYEREQGAKSIAELVQEVIAGKWGTGEERKKKLTEAGFNFAQIQKNVNRAMKEQPQVEGEVVVDNKPDFTQGDIVKLKAGATYYDGTEIPSWLFEKELYVRRFRSDKVIVSIYKTGAITGVVKATNIELVNAAN